MVAGRTKALPPLRSGSQAIDVAYEPALRLGRPKLVLCDPTRLIQDVAEDGRVPAIQREPMPEVTTLNLLIEFDRLLEEVE